VRRFREDRKEKRVKAGPSLHHAPILKALPEKANKTPPSLVYNAAEHPFY